MTSKERAYLRGEANHLTAICFVGKDGLDEQLFSSIEAAITSRELIKISLQESAPVSSREAANAIAEKLQAETVQVIGRRIVLYRRNPEKDKYGVQ